MTATATATARATATRRAGALAPAFEGLLVAGVSLLCAAWALQLWDADFGVPWRYVTADDAKFYLMLAKGLTAHGSYLSNLSLGAPFGQHLYDLPQGADNLNLLILRGLGLFSANPAVVVNVFYLLTFGLASVTCHFVLRALGLSAAVSGVISVLFSLLTYHFFRGESHLFLSAYYAVPLAGYLFLRLLEGSALFAHRAHAPGITRGPWVSRRSLATVGLCLVVGADNLYYAAFALVLLGAATAIAAARRRRRAAFEGLVIIALITATLAGNLAPSIVYRVQHGPNNAVERSAAADASNHEAFALSPTNLVLPAPGDRIAPLRALAARYDHAVAPRYCESCYASLGTIGTLGFGWLGVCALATLLGGAGRIRSRRLLPHAGIGVGIALGAGAVGGFGSLVEVFLTPDIRAWNRISVVIAFFSLLAAALLLDALLTPLRRRRSGAVLAGGTLAAVLAFGAYDQTTTAFVPAYAANARQWRSDAVFVAEIEARLPPGASVFQLPYVPFPEGYPLTHPSDQVATYATKYELLRGYLHSSTLRWSYGAMKGRAGDWAAALAGQPLSLVMAGAAAARFDGVWVDPAGFEPSKGTRVLSTLRGLLSIAPLTSPNRDLWFLDLRPFRARLQRMHSPAALAQLRERLLHPLATGCPARWAASALAPFAPLGRATAAGSVVAGLTGPPCPS